MERDIPQRVMADRGPSLPQELCDLILDEIPTEDLSPFSFVCKNWLHTVTPRLLREFSWPPKSLEERKEHLEDDFYTRFVDLLASSPRLRGAIRTLRIGPVPSRSELVGEMRTSKCFLDLSVLFYVIEHCPSLDSLTLSGCRLRQDATPLFNKQYGCIGMLALNCPMESEADAAPLVHAISSFSRIDVLRLRLGSGSHRPETPFPAQFEVGCIEDCDQYGRLAMLTTNMMLEHLCATPSVSASLRSLVTGDPLYSYLLERLGPAAERLEHVAYRVRSSILPSFDSLPSLRRLTMYTSKDQEYHSDWSSTMRDLGLAPNGLQRVTIYLKYCHTAKAVVQEADALDGLQKMLLNADWAPLERFIETRPSVEAVELRIWCSFARQTSHYEFEARRDVDFGRVEEIVREVVLHRLSNGTAERVTVVATSRRGVVLAQ